jgi:hypothetical protein
MGSERSSGTSTEVPAWELTNAQPTTAHPVGRSRVDLDRPLAAHLIQVLCPEFTLVVITNATDWAEVRGRCQLTGSPASLDFSQGAIVGLVANVGECPRGVWPIELEVARVLEGEGSVEFRFVGGLYYPVRTAGYLELAYVPGLREVRMVRVGHRSFIIGTESAR